MEVYYRGERIALYGSRSRYEKVVENRAGPRPFPACARKARRRSSLAAGYETCALPIADTRSPRRPCPTSLRSALKNRATLQDAWQRK